MTGYTLELNKGVISLNKSSPLIAEIPILMFEDDQAVWGVLRVTPMPSLLNKAGKLSKQIL